MHTFASVAGALWLECPVSVLWIESNVVGNIWQALFGPSNRQIAEWFLYVSGRFGLVGKSPLLDAIGGYQVVIVNI